MELIDLAAGQFHQEPGVFRLLIVDSIIGKFDNNLILVKNEQMLHSDWV